jgi:hypothetical protein
MNQNEQLLNTIPPIMNGAISTNNSAEMSIMEIANTNGSDNDVVLTKKSVNVIDGVKVRYTQSNSRSGSERHSIVLLGDSHTRGCADKIIDYLIKNFDVTGFVKPGSDILTLSVSAKGAIEKLTKNGMLVFSGRH